MSRSTWAWGGTKKRRCWAVDTPARHALAIASASLQAFICACNEYAREGGAKRREAMKAGSLQGRREASREGGGPPGWMARKKQRGKEKRTACSHA